MWYRGPPVPRGTGGGGEHNGTEGKTAPARAMKA